MNETPKLNILDLSHWKGFKAVRVENLSTLVSLFTPETCTSCGRHVWTQLHTLAARDEDLLANKIPLVEFLPERGVVIREDLGLLSHIFCPSCYAEWLQPKARDYPPE